jgi:hypothetical protein
MEMQWMVGAGSLPSMKKQWNRNSRWLRQLFELTELGLDLQKPNGPKLLPCINHWHDFLFFIFSMISHRYLAPLGMTGKIEKKKAGHFRKKQIAHGSMHAFCFSKCPAICGGQIQLDNVLPLDTHKVLLYGGEGKVLELCHC